MIEKNPAGGSERNAATSRCHEGMGMGFRRVWTDAVIGISPFAMPDAGLTAAVCAAG